MPRCETSTLITLLLIVTAGQAQVSPPGEVVRDTSRDAAKNLQESYQATFDRVVHELESQAHFVPYAPPAFIPFRHGLYVQLSFTTTLPETAAGSKYRLAALAFDRHVAHLIRPVLAYFKAQSDFDGIDFSTTVRLASNQKADTSPLAVEFISPLKLLASYASFDTTGQQLIDASYLLINGERVSLDLQAAEAGPTVASPSPAKPLAPAATPAADPAKQVVEKADASGYHARGRQLLQSGNYAEALQLLTQAIQLAPNMPQAYNARGYAHLKLKHYPEAIADFDHAIGLQPRYQNAYINRAVARRLTGDRAGAAEDEALARNLAKAN